MTILALCWHPGKTNIQTAGGFKRFYEVLKHAPCPVTVLDKYPSIYSQINNPRVTVIEYGRNREFTWITDRFVSACYLLLQAFRLRPRPSVIYVPFSELPHLSFVAVILKLAFHCRLVFCNLNINRIYTDRLANVFFHLFADEIITLSKPLQNDLAKTGIFATYVNGVGYAPRTTSIRHIKKLYDAIFIGRHTQEKGFKDMLEIWDILVNQCSHKLKLVTIGDIPLVSKKGIDATIRRLDLGDTINFRGNVSDDQKNLLIGQSKICVFPSYFEGWGIVPMECLSAGLPVVAYNLPVYRESISSSKAFRVVPLGDKERFASEVISVLKHYLQLSREALKWEPAYTWDAISHKEWKLICPS